MAEISVIVPVYNVGELLEPCIMSVLDQTFGDWELLLVNDASTDGSLGVCRRFAAADARIKVFPLPSNRGLSGARNFGIDQASGRYLTFLDGDDRLAPTFLETLREVAASRDCDIVASTQARVEPGSAMRRPGRPRITVYNPVAAVRAVLYQTRLNNSACGRLFSRDILRIERFRSGWFEDLDFFYRVFLRARRIALVDSPLYLYSVNPASYMQNFNPGRAVVLDVCERMTEFMEAGYPQLVRAAHSRSVSAAFNILMLLKKHECAEPAIRARCLDIIRRYRGESLLDPRVRIKNKLAVAASYLGGLKVFERF